MNIRLHQAVLAALAVGAAGTAGAVDITTVPANNVIYASGSTAIDSAFKAYLYNSVDTSTPCASSVDVYAQASGAASKFTAVACISNPVFANDGVNLTTGVPIAIIKEDGAGSLNGGPAVQNQPFPGSPNATDGKLNFPTISQLTTTNCGAGTAKTGLNLQNYTNHSCTGFTAVLITPQLGFADVEIELFGFDHTTPVALNQGPTVQVPFAPVVSLGLYHALQSVEGLTVGTEGVANMPSLTRAQLSALFSGNAPSTGWSWLKSQDGTKAVGTSVVNFGIANSAQCWTGTSTGTACTTPGNSAPSSTKVFICERGSNSGSQKSVEILFNDANCGAGVYGFATPTNLAATTLCNSSYAKDGCSWTTSTLKNVPNFPGNGTGDLLDCINGHDASGHFALGFASIDNLSAAEQSNTTRRDFRYIKVDGVVPSVENTAAGKYLMVSQSFWYSAPSSATWSVTSVTGAGSPAEQLLNTMTTSTTQAIGTVGSVAGVNAASIMGTQGFNGGVLVIPGVNAAVPPAGSATSLGNNPTSSVTKASSTGATNNCIRPITYATAAETTAGSPAYAP